ncbi:MAG: hypothetical protein E7247_01040 [Paenibacillaceae bacterium]|nr:hypothetical protein [Paenibacillaceae bacterium]
MRLLAITVNPTKLLFSVESELSVKQQKGIKMALQLFSEWLLKERIAELSEKEKLNDIEEIWLDQCQKELAVIWKIKIEVIDMTGTLEEAKERFEGQSLIMMDPVELKLLQTKARKYDMGLIAGEERYYL